MKKVIIAEVTGFIHNGKPSAHYWKVARQYEQILSGRFRVKIAGPKQFSKYLPEYKIIAMPYSNKGLKQYNAIESIIKILREIANYRFIMKHNADIVIFQSSGFLSLCISLFLFKPDRDIFMIQYTDILHSFKYRFLFSRARKYLRGVISSIEHVAGLYHDNYLIIPDYLPVGNKECDENSDYIYDYCVVGIMFPGKDVDDVVNTFRNTDKKVVIAGYFKDKSMYERIIRVKSTNIKVINEYISKEKYDKIICSSKYVILPYTQYYNDASSGVALDALYRGRPVITKNLRGFDYIDKNGLGFLYNESVSEFSQDKNHYKDYKSNIRQYISQKRKLSRELAEFIKSNGRSEE